MTDATQDTVPERLSAFFDRVGANKSCPICSHDEWAVERDAGIMNYVPAMRVDGTVLAAQVYLVICKNCGFTRPHHAKIVDGMKEIPA